MPCQQAGANSPCPWHISGAVAVIKDTPAGSPLIMLYLNFESVMKNISRRPVLHFPGAMPQCCGVTVSHRPISGRLGPFPSKSPRSPALGLEPHAGSLKPNTQEQHVTVMKHLRGLLNAVGILYLNYSSKNIMPPCFHCLPAFLNVVAFFPEC